MFRRKTYSNDKHRMVMTADKRYKGEYMKCGRWLYMWFGYYVKLRKLDKRERRMSVDQLAAQQRGHRP